MYSLPDGAVAVAFEMSVAHMLKLHLSAMKVSVAVAARAPLLWMLLGSFTASFLNV